MSNSNTSSYSFDTKSRLYKRVTKEIHDLHNDKNELSKESIYSSFTDNNGEISGIFTIEGVDHTPYEGGIYLFFIKIVNEYPFKPPYIKFLTSMLDPNPKNVRFNPNLYTKRMDEGKVCLSILGTFTGPSWSPSMTLTTIAVNIRSLFIERPILNEPGHERDYDDPERKIKAIEYEKILSYENIRIIPDQFQEFHKTYGTSNELLLSPQHKQHYKKTLLHMVFLLFKNYDRHIAKLDDLIRNGEEGKKYIAMSPMSFTSKFELNDTKVKLQRCYQQYISDNQLCNEVKQLHN
jgi:ubiquitin-protein ligase